MEVQLGKSGENIDFGLDTDKIINFRLAELNSLSKEIKSKGNRSALQRLPRYARRRASSHNPKRIPFKFRKKVSSTVLASGNSALKERKRKQRKKHVSVLKKKILIKKRNKKEKRTLLHIWFKKRFQVIEKLNYLVPIQNNTKNFRNLHKVSQESCSFYYLPLMKLIEIKFKQQEDLKKTIHLFTPFFYSKPNNLFNTEISLIFHEIKEEKFSNLVIPSSLFVFNETSLFLSVYDNFYEEIIKFLNFIFLENQIQNEIFERRIDLERFRIIGPNGLKIIESLLNSQSEEKIENIKKVNLVENKENLLFIKETIFFPKCQNEDFNLILILKNKKKFIYDVIIKKNLVKSFWYNLTKNRAHLVGGYFNLQYFALQNEFLIYPFYGFIDIDNNNENLKIKFLKEVLLNQFKNNEAIIKRVTIIRYDNFLKLFSKPIDNFKELFKIYNEKNYRLKYLNVKLSLIKKGLLEENDLIFLPNKEDFNVLYNLLTMSKEDQYINQNFSDIPLESNKLLSLGVLEKFFDKSKFMNFFQNSLRPIIGVVDYGNYCLKTGKSEAFGIICAKNLMQLIELEKTLFNENKELIKILNNKLVLLVRKKNSTKFRFCYLTIQNFHHF